MESTNIFDKNWKSLTKPGKLEIESNQDRRKNLNFNWFKYVHIVLLFLGICSGKDFVRLYMSF